MIYACTFDNCRLIFNRPWRLKRHEEYHKGIRLFACSHEGCSKSYTTSSHLKRHLSTFHGGAEKRAATAADTFACSFANCSAVYRTASGLQKHEAKHLGAARCDECNRFFKNERTYEKHAASHLRKKLAKSEEEVEEGEAQRPEIGSYFCEDCRLAFASKATFAAHCRNSPHAPLRLTYSCAESGCGKSFRHKRNLKEHIRNRHTAAAVAAAFICGAPRCAKVFRHKRNLRAHIATKHANRVHACPVEKCSRSFSFRKSLNQHVRRHEFGNLLPAKTKKIRKQAEDTALKIVSSICE